MSSHKHSSHMPSGGGLPHGFHGASTGQQPPAPEQHKPGCPAQSGYGHAPEPCICAPEPAIPFIGTVDEQLPEPERIDPSPYPPEPAPAGEAEWERRYEQALRKTQAELERVKQQRDGLLALLRKGAEGNGLFKSACADAIAAAEGSKQ